MTNADALAAELIAFANTRGGRLFIGVGDNGKIAGLTLADIARLNQLLSNAASQNVRPPINPISTNIRTDEGLVMAVLVEEGMNKPYMDLQGRIWVKSGADKRSVTAREEMQRLFQESGLIYADETPVRSATLEDLDKEALAQYFNRRYGRSIESTELPLPQLLQSLNLARDGVPNLAGMLLFGKMPQAFKPAFTMKAVSFPGIESLPRQRRDRRDAGGTVSPWHGLHPAKPAPCAKWRELQQPQRTGDPRYRV